jgi:hypothetical protein
MTGMTDVQEALDGLDGPTADEVRPLVDHLVGTEPDRVPLTTVTQLDVQHFLWHDLPTKWLTDSYDHHELAWALADFFDAAGLGRYAGICRDERTHSIIAAWHRNLEEGDRLATEALGASGVLPPDTGTLTFGEVMGGTEARLHADLSRILEQAIVEGRLDPSTRGFAAAARRLVEEALRTPSQEYDGRAPATLVRRERAAIWAQRIGPPDLWERILPDLDEEPLVPVNVEASLAPAIALIEAIGDGVTLTKSLNLPPALALELDARFGWSDEYGSTRPRGESDLPPLRFLDEHLREQRLLTRRGTRLTVSARGRRCRGEPEQLWRAVVDPEPRWPAGFAADAVAVLAAVLLEADAQSGERLGERMEEMLSGKWRATDDQGMGDSVWWIRVDWYRLGITLGWWERRSGRLGLGWTLSRYGRGAAASAFWTVAGAPMSRP